MMWIIIKKHYFLLISSAKWLLCLALFKGEVTSVTKETKVKEIEMLEVRGARQHNLKNVDLTLPKKEDDRFHWCKWIG